MNFFSRIEKPERVSTPAGSGTANKYSIKLDKVGHKTVYKSGETDLYAQIQEHLEGVKIENIIKKAQLGDTSFMRPVAYADVTKMPRTLAEAQQMIINLTNEFNSLPIEERRKFNFSPEEYVANYDKVYMAKVVEKVENNVEKEAVTAD